MVEVHEDKCQTFRKRRLSFAKLVVEADTTPTNSTTTAMTLEEGSKERDVDLVERIDRPLLVACDDVVLTNHPEEDDIHHDPQTKKAQTFRRRRLSLTNRSSEEAAATDETLEPVASSDVEDDAVVLGPASLLDNSTSTTTTTLTNTSSPLMPCKRRRLSSASVSSRRSSNASTNSNISSSANSLKTVVVHAGELLSQPPPSPALVSANRLYDYGPMARRQQQQEQFQQWQQQQQQQQRYLFTTPVETNLNNNINTTTATTTKANRPRWQKRILRHHEEDEGILPFPRDVVGTFSCHGVEPIYENVDPNVDYRLKQPMTTTIAKINQDRGGIAFPYAKSPETALFAVYDGHGQGGELVSQFCLYEVQRRLAKHPEFMTNVENAFRDTFLAIDSALLREPLVESVFAGSTACVALLRGNTLFLSNVGDSRAVLARRKPSSDNSSTTTAGDYQVIDLTVDQNPNLPHEQRRIEAMGGFVSPPPEPGLSARVWLDAGFSQIGLAMSRSMGDHAVKSIGVIAEPVVTRHDVTPDDEFFILASDGVWEFVSSEEAVKVVADHLDRGATKACQALIEAAAAKWHDEEGDYRDDITAMVIRIPDLWTHHPSHAAAAVATATAVTTNQPQEQEEDAK